MAAKKYFINTPVFRGRFVKVFTPEIQKNDEGEETEQYKLTALFEKGELLTEIKAKATELMTDKFGPFLDAQGQPSATWPKPKSENNPKGWQKPWYDQWLKDPANKDADKTYEGFVGGALFINMKTNYKPDVVLQNPEIKAMPKDIYDGAYYIAHIELWWYGDNASSKGNKGLGVTVHALQKVKEGEPLAGSQVQGKAVFKPVPVDASQGAAAVFTGGGGAAVDPMS